RCEHCDRFIESDTPWVCGFCSAKNTKPEDYSFLFKCQHCSAVPKAYKCHHAGCGELIFLSEDRLEENFACCINSPHLAQPQQKQERRKARREELEDEIDMVKLNMRLSS